MIVKKTTIAVSILFITGIYLVFVGAINSSGDGTHTLNKGDILTLDNGWKIEITGIFFTSIGGSIQFNAYDEKNNQYPAPPFNNYIQKVEGIKKFGTEEILKIELEILEFSGNTYPTASPMVTEYEKVKIKAISIDENLPGKITNTGENQPLEETNKKIIYKDGKKVSINIGEETTLGNGYKLKLEGFNSRWENPEFSLYDSHHNKINEKIMMSKDTDAFLGSLVHVNDYDAESVDLTIVDGSIIPSWIGWNLFSIQVEDGDGLGTILENTCNENTIWKWDIEKKDYEPVGKLTEGTRIPANEGLWVKINEINVASQSSCEIIVSGKKSVSTNGQKLKRGWNLIGSPMSSYGQIEILEEGSNFNLLEFDEILGDCKIEKGPWQYISNRGQTVVGQLHDISEENKYTKPLNDALRIFRGYFIKVAKDCTLTDK